MKKLLFFVVFLFISLAGRVLAQTITSPTASYTLSTAYTNGTPNDVIYGFCTPNASGAAVTGTLAATVGLPNCSFTWTVFDPVTNTYNPYTSQTGLTTSNLTGLANGGYHVTVKNSLGSVVACDLAWVWVNQTSSTVAPIAAGCSPFTLNGTASAVSNFTYYNPPPEPFTVGATTSINVCFSATHTFDSDLGFFLVGPPTCGSPTVTLSPNPGANGQGSVCNSGDNVSNLCFTTAPSANFDPCAAATPYTGTYQSYGPAGTPTIINWSALYGCDASEGGWSVQIYDCIGADVGALTSASISFNGNSGCGASTINYNSGAINSAINDNSCSAATASIYTVPGSPPGTPITITNSVTYQWTSVPASTIPNSTTSLTPSINPAPTVDTWYYLTVTDNFGCSKKDSAFFDYSPPGVPTITPAGPFCVNAAATNLSATPTGGTWSGTGITSAAAGTFNPATAGTGTFTVTYTTPGVCGGSNTTSIVVNALPTVTVPTNTTVCAGATVPAANFTTVPAGGTVSWTNNNTATGLAASGTGNIAAFTATNAGSTAITSVVTVTPSLNGCTGTPVSYTITVNPTPVLNTVTSQTVCNTAATAAVNFTSVPAGATVNWTNSNTAIGIGAGTSGNIASFTGTNATAAQISGNFSATPTLSGCVGAPITFTISIDPTPVLAAISSQTLCAAASTNAINFVSNPTGASIAWTNSNAAIGIGTNGSGDIVSFSATNGSAAAISGNFSATPTLNTCVGAPQTFTITVNPTPVLTAVPNEAVCEGVATTAVNFTSNPTGATVNWTNTVTTTGLGASGIGNIPSFTGLNGGSTQLNSVVTATPTLSSCIGSPITFTLTVNPTPTLASVTSQTVCEGSPTTAVIFSPTPAGVTTINWTNSAPTIGQPAIGAGDIASYSATNGTGAIVNAAFVATPVIGSCTGTPVNFTITVNPAVTLSAVANQTVCSGVATAAVNFASNPAGATINWTNTVIATGLGASGIGNIPSFTGLNNTSSSLNSVVTATPSLNNCTYAPITFTITVDPTPSLAAVTSQTVCEGNATSAVIFAPTPAGVTTINWTNSATSIGQPAVGAGDITSYTATNGTGAIVNAAFVATPVIGACSGTPVNFTITVNPSVTANAVTSFTVCNTATVPASAFASNPTGATFSWINSDPTIGLAANGNGDYASFAASNLGTSPVVATVSVTPTLNTCVGPTITYSITINPTPAPPTVAAVTYCLNDVAVPLTAVASAGGTLNWWGTSAAGGTSTATGPTPTTVAVGTTNYYVSQTILGCESPRAQIQVSVSTLPSIIDPLDVVVCSGDVVPSQVFTSTPLGANLTWTNNNAATGLAASGTGDVPSFTASNGGTTSITSTIIVTPNIGVCVGASITYTVTVKPLPSVTVSDITVCNNASTVATNWTSTPTGATFTWNNSDPSIGIGATGAGNIPSFTAANSALNPINGSVTVTPTLNACVGPVATFSITVNPTPAAPTGTNPVYCLNDASNQLSATGTSLLWYSAATGGTGSTTAPTPSTSSAGTSSAYVSQTLLGCESPRAQITTLVNPLPTATLAPIAPKCPPLCTNLSLSSTSNLVAYSWNLGDGTTFAGNDTVYNHCYSTPGSYSVTVTIIDNNTCQKTIVYPNAAVVAELPSAQFSFGPQPASLLNPTITFNSLSTGLAPLTNNWNFGDSIGVASNQVSPVYTYEHSGSYNVQLITINGLGCVDTAYSTVVIENDFAIYVPNAFSPNEDGINDTFFPKMLGIDEKGFKMYIFDRWGNMIYFTDDVNKPWPGKVQGKENIVQIDTYVWKINCRSESGQKIEKSGHVTVVR